MPSFDFAAYVSAVYSNEFAHIVKMNFLMWLIPILYVSFPDGSYAGLWITVSTTQLPRTVIACIHMQFKSVVQHSIISMRDAKQSRVP
jgi:hypothetical protein